MICQDGCIAKQGANEPIRQRSLRPNPFTAYRDPNTGRWMIVLPVPCEEGAARTNNPLSRVEEMAQSLSETL